MNPTWSVCLSMWALSRILIRLVSKGQSAFCLHLCAKSDFHIVLKAHPIIFFGMNPFPQKKETWVKQQVPLAFFVFCFEPYVPRTWDLTMEVGWATWIGRSSSRIGTTCPWMVGNRRGAYCWGCNGKGGWKVVIMGIVWMKWSLRKIMWNDVVHMEVYNLVYMY